MNETVEPRGVVAVLIALVVVAIVGGVVFGRPAAEPVHPDPRRRRAAEQPRPARQAVRDHPDQAHPGRPHRRGILARADRLLQPAGRGRRDRPGEHQPAHAVSADAHRPRRGADPAGAARTAPGRPSRCTAFPSPGPPPVSDRAAGIRRRFHPAVAPAAGLVGLLALLPLPLAICPGYPAGPGRPAGSRRQDGGAALAAGAQPATRWSRTARVRRDRVVEFAVEGQGARRRFRDALLLRPERQDPLHGRHRRAAAAARRRPAAPSQRIQWPYRATAMSGSTAEPR